MRIKRYEVPFGISDEKVRLASLAQNDTKTAFGSNANLIPRRFARGASFEATSAPANAKRTPQGVLCVVCSDLNDDIVFVITKNTQLTEKCPKPF